MASSSVNPTEQLARFLTQSNEFSSLHRKVKPQAFMPNSTGKTSVFRISDNPELGTIQQDDIWNLGLQYVTPTRGPILAFAQVATSSVLEQSLELDSDGVPHPRHANIVGWPDKEKSKEIAADLANQSILVLDK